MEEEMDSLMHNQTWGLVRFPASKTTLQNKWVYRLKEEDGGKQRYKARLVVKGIAHKKGIDFDEIFSPVVKITSIRTILSLLAAEDLHLEQLDVKTTFLHGYFEEEIYMQQPEGYEVKGTEKLKVPENNNNQKPQQQQQPQQKQAPQTPESGVKRSTRISRPPERYSPSLYYLLLTDSGEPECYEEAMQVESRKKWELAMEEVMESLMHN